MRIILLSFLLMSCSSAWHLKQAEKHLKKAEIKGASVRVDTVYKEIPFYIDSVRIDSILIAKEGDTVYLEKDRLKIRYINLPGDSIYIEGECEADTVYQKVPIVVTKEIKAKGLDWKWLFVVGVVCFVLAYFIKR